MSDHNDLNHSQPRIDTKDRTLIYFMPFAQKLTTKHVDMIFDSPHVRVEEVRNHAVVKPVRFIVTQKAEESYAIERRSMILVPYYPLRSFIHIVIFSLDVEGKNVDWRWHVLAWNLKKTCRLVIQLKPETR